MKPVGAYLLSLWYTYNKPLSSGHCMMLSNETLYHVLPWWAVLSFLMELLAERSESPVDVFSGVYRWCRHSVADRYRVTQAIPPWSWEVLRFSVIILPPIPLANACSQKWSRAGSDCHCSGKLWQGQGKRRTVCCSVSLPRGAQPSDCQLARSRSAHKMTEWNSSLPLPMPSWIPEQAGRAREQGPCQSAALGSPGTPHTFAIFGQKISLSQTRLCSNYTFLFWERGDINGLRPWGLYCQLWRGGGNKYTVLYIRSSSSPYPLPIFPSSWFPFPQIFHSFQICSPEICRIQRGDWLILQWRHKPIRVVHIWVLTAQP